MIVPIFFISISISIISFITAQSQCTLATFEKKCEALGCKWCEDGEYCFSSCASVTKKDTDVPLAGAYSDPNHPSCKRIIGISSTSGSFSVFGTDAAGGEGVPCDGETDIAWGPLPGSIDKVMNCKERKE